MTNLSHTSSAVPQSPLDTAALARMASALFAALPGEQPRVRVPVIVEDPADGPRLGMIDADFAASQNHPSPHPDVSRYWDQISEGFMQASQRLRGRSWESSLFSIARSFRFEPCPLSAHC